MDLKQFCENLKSARHYQELNLDDVARETRIASRFLAALEDGNWHLIPHGYLRGYLSNYAESVGMNLDRVLESFEDLEYIPPLQTETEPVLESEANSLQETQPAEHRIPSLLEALPLLRWLLIVAVATVTLLLLGGLYLLIESPLEEPVEQPVRQQSENITPPPAPQPTDSSLFVVEKVNLAFLFTDSCYLKVSRDDSLFTELIYLPGDSVAFTSAGNLNVTVGNPQAAVIYFNGRNAGNVGQTNRPAHLLVDPGGIQHSSLRNQP